MQVRLGLERQREELQRQAAALDSQLTITRARLEDAASETSSLTQRLALERSEQGRGGLLRAGRHTLTQRPSPAKPLRAKHCCFRTEPETRADLSC
jgi:chromosome segregation ATPase